MKTALTIAGTDPSGGAGIQADIKTMTANGVFALAAVTALVAQNTTGVKGVQESTPDFLAEQLDCVFTDIFPDAVKTGMVSSVPLIEVIADKLQQYRVKNLVVDPVMVSTSGDRLISEDALDALKSRLLPLATVLTPNVPEAEILSGGTIRSYDDMALAGKEIQGRYGCAVLCKGGHNVQDANDVLISRDGAVHFFPSARVDNPNTHGTGCTLSGAIASNLAKGYDLETSVKRGKAYIFGALSAQLNLGRGSGPLDHLWDLHSRFIDGEGAF
ncbi:MAG: bifunctional hydroxymethylpyrimidine kinase/phosphomethylpyrimidine kinase [Oscillibacter sp.]|nr:bifunctional hydroxymethylpyrimidine kinase/phosphomethylpyrimidine kinase [Oscillibacter sp.]